MFRRIKKTKKLSYREQIVRKLRTQYVAGIYNNSVILKFRLRVTEYCWKRQHSIDDIQLTNYLTLNIIVILKCGLEVTQDH